MITSDLIAAKKITDEDILLVDTQLLKIFASDQFKYAKQMRRFLEYIVKKTIQGQGSELKQYTIAVDALSFSEDFDPELNPAVRILGGRVRRRLDEYYENNNNDKIIFSIPKGSYIPEFTKINTNIQKNKNKNLQVSRGPTLALLSFSDKTENQTSNSILIQITDDLAFEMSRFISLKLVVNNPCGDKEQAHAVNLDFESTHKADYLLALFMQKIDNKNDKYRLVYRLILADTQEILWSENYVITGSSIQEEEHIVSKITVTVGDHLEGIMHTHWSRNFLINTEAIPDYHKVLVYFRNYRDHLGKKSFAKGIKSCIDALKRNPNDVIANIVYATYCRREYIFGYGVIESPLEKGQELIETAIRLSPNTPEAHYVHGLILFCQKDWKQSVEEFEMARNNCKNDMAMQFGIGLHYYKLDQWEKGLKIVNDAMLLSNTFSSVYHFVPFLDFYRQEKYEQAFYEAKKITIPSIVHGPLARSICNAQLGNLQEAKKEFNEVLNRFPSFMRNGKKYVRRMIVSEILIEKIWDGVMKIPKS